MCKFANISKNWIDLIEEAKERIAEMAPWEILEAYMMKVGGIMDASDEAFASVVEAGAFRLQMRYGELLWEFFMPKTSTAASSCRQEIAFLWDEFVPEADAISYRKEIHIPYRDCGISGFLSVIKAEMNEAMARALANDLLEASVEEV